MECDMCGREGILVDAIIEGSSVRVCRNCANFGKVVRLPTKEIPKKEGKERRSTTDFFEGQEFVVEGYPSRIKRARELRRMTQEELGKNIAEKESVIHKLESGQLEPPINIAKKLEQFLKIKLVSAPEKEKQDKGNKRFNIKDDSLTIGDILKMKNEK